jgi:hypothetical protein
LSAITYARFCAAVRRSILTVGTSVRPTIFRFDPAVAGQNGPLLVDQDRVGESEFANAYPKRSNLILGMGPGISIRGP